MTVSASNIGPLLWRLEEPKLSRFWPPVNLMVIYNESWSPFSVTNLGDWSCRPWKVLARSWLPRGVLKRLLRPLDRYRAADIEALAQPAAPRDLNKSKAERRNSKAGCDQRGDQGERGCERQVREIETRQPARDFRRDEQHEPMQQVEGIGNVAQPHQRRRIQRRRQPARVADGG